MFLYHVDEVTVNAALGPGSHIYGCSVKLRDNLGTLEHLPTKELDAFLKEADWGGNIHQ